MAGFVNDGLRRRQPAQHLVLPARAGGERQQRVSQPEGAGQLQHSRQNGDNNFSDLSHCFNPPFGGAAAAPLVVSSFREARVRPTMMVSSAASTWPTMFSIHCTAELSEWWKMSASASPSVIS